MSAQEGLVERLLAYDADWQAKCDQWSAQANALNPDANVDWSVIRKTDHRLAAARITSLESELAEARGTVELTAVSHQNIARENEALINHNARQARALEPFANLIDLYDNTCRDGWISWIEFLQDHFWPSAGECAAARAAIAGHEQAEATMTAEQMRERAAFYHDDQAQTARNSTHCGDSSAAIASYHRVADWHEQCARDIRALPASPGKGAE